MTGEGALLGIPEDEELSKFAVSTGGRHDCFNVRFNASEPTRNLL